MKIKLADIGRRASLIKENASITEADRDLTDALTDKIEAGKKTKGNGVVSHELTAFYRSAGSV